MAINGEGISVQPIDRGRAVTVYSLKHDARVLKVYRSSLDLPPGTRLTKLQSNIELGKDQLERWYARCDDLLVPTTLCKVAGPILGAPALALLQPRIGEGAKDFFRDYDDQQLIDLLTADREFLQQFKSFVAGTKTALAEGTRCFDMYGEKNLCVIQKPEGTRLCVVDYGVYDLEERARNAPNAYKSILQFHDRLFALEAQLATIR